jgi:carbamoyltransferase
VRILGVAGGFGHDASAALIVDGLLVAMVEEERLSRRKFALEQAPVLSTLACLRAAGITLADVDLVAISWDPSLDPSNDRMPAAQQRLLSARDLQGLRDRPRRNYDHHRCHAASAYAFSGLRTPATVLVMDGRGEYATTTVCRMSPSSYEPVAVSGLEASLGTFYAAATDYIGFGAGGQGKTMGLAAYGTPRYDFPELFVDGLIVRSNVVRPPGMAPTPFHRTTRPGWIELMTRVFGPAGDATATLDPFLDKVPRDGYAGHHADAAASAQAALERLVSTLVGNILAAYPDDPLLLTGGVALNCSVNGRLRLDFPGADLRFTPVPHDSGTSLGAAVIAAWEAGEALETPVAPSAYLGIGWTDADIAAMLRGYGIPAAEPADLPGAVADRILDGRVVGWFQGRSEVGPRALGHRSIVASPFDASLVGRLNRQVKARESWRPFGPSVHADDMPELFPVKSAPYMVESYTVDGAVPAVRHADGTSRPHSADSADQSRRYVDLLVAVRQRAGLGVVLNTSFNTGAEPIVYSPVHALRTYVTSTLDALAIGPFLLEKQR